MTKPLDLTGQRFGRLTATESLGSIKTQRYWAVTCDCGNEDLVVARDLKNGKTTSCGCQQREAVANANKERLKHGGKRNGVSTTENSAWLNLRKNEPFVPEWNDFKQFFKDLFGIS